MGNGHLGLAVGWTFPPWSEIESTSAKQDSQAPERSHHNLAQRQHRSRLIALLLDEGHSRGALSKSLAQENSANLEKAFGSLSLFAQKQYRTQFGSKKLQELFAIAKNSDPELFATALFHFGVRQEKSRHYDLATGVYSLLLQEVEGKSPFPQEILVKARERLDAMNGKGSGALRAGFYLRNIFHEVGHLPTLFAIGGAGLSYKLIRFHTLRNLVTRKAAHWLTRGAGARTVAGLVGFLGEAPAFSLLGKLGEEFSGNKQDWSGSTLARDFASSFLILGGLKLGAWGSRTLFNRVHGINPFSGRSVRLPGFSGISQKLFPQAGMMAGILLGQRAEIWTGLMEPGHSHSPGMDASVLLLQFNLMSGLLRRGTPKRLQNIERALDRYSEILTKRRPGNDPISRPPIPEQYGWSLAWNGPQEVLDPRMPRPFQMSSNKLGEGPSPKEGVANPKGKRVDPLAELQKNNPTTLKWVLETWRAYHRRLREWAIERTPLPSEYQRDPKKHYREIADFYLSEQGVRQVVRYNVQNFTTEFFNQESFKTGEPPAEFAHWFDNNFSEPELKTPPPIQRGPKPKKYRLPVQSQVLTAKAESKVSESAPKTKEATEEIIPKEREKPKTPLPPDGPKDPTRDRLQDWQFVTRRPNLKKFLKLQKASDKSLVELAEIYNVTFSPEIHLRNYASYEGEPIYIANDIEVSLLRDYARLGRQSFGEVIFFARKKLARSWSMARAAGRLGTSCLRLSNLEKNIRIPSESELRKIAEVYELDIEFIRGLLFNIEAGPLPPPNSSLPSLESFKAWIESSGQDPVQLAQKMNGLFFPKINLSNYPSYSGEPIYISSREDATRLNAFAKLERQSLGETLLFARKALKRNWKITEAAEALWITPRLLVTMEKNEKRPDEDQLHRIADVYAIDVDLLKSLLPLSRGKVQTKNGRKVERPTINAFRAWLKDTTENPEDLARTLNRIHTPEIDLTVYPSYSGKPIYISDHKDVQRLQYYRDLNYQSVGEIIFFARKDLARNWKISEAALGHLNMDSGRLSQLERNISPPSRYEVMRFAKVYGLEKEFLHQVIKNTFNPESAGPGENGPKPWPTQAEFQAMVQESIRSAKKLAQVLNQKNAPDIDLTRYPSFQGEDFYIADSGESNQLREYADLGYQSVGEALFFARKNPKINLSIEEAEKRLRLHPGRLVRLEGNIYPPNQAELWAAAKAYETDYDFFYDLAEKTQYALPSIP